MKEKKKSRLGLWVLLANVILWPIAIYLVISSAGGKQEHMTPEKAAYTAAKYMMQENVLKIPDSAKFQPFEEISIAVDNNTYYVRMWIQAENALGVPVKSYYTITVRYEPENEQWRLINYKEE